MTKQHECLKYMLQFHHLLKMLSLHTYPYTRHLKTLSSLWCAINVTSLAAARSMAECLLLTSVNTQHRQKMLGPVTNGRDMVAHVFHLSAFTLILFTTCLLLFGTSTHQSEHVLIFYSSQLLLWGTEKVGILHNELDRRKWMHYTGEVRNGQELTRKAF